MTSSNFESLIGECQANSPEIAGIIVLGALKTLLSWQLPKLYQEHFQALPKPQQMTFYNVLFRPINANLVTKCLLALEYLYDFHEHTEIDDASTRVKPWNILEYSFFLGSCVAIVCQSVDSISFSTSQSECAPILNKRTIWTLTFTAAIIAAMVFRQKTEECDIYPLVPFVTSMIASLCLTRAFMPLINHDLATFKGKNTTNSTAAKKPYTPYRLTSKFGCGIFLMATVSRLMSWLDNALNANNLAISLTLQVPAAAAYSLGAWGLHVLCSLTDDYKLSDTDWKEAELSAICVFLETFAYYTLGFETQDMSTDTLPLAIRQELNVCLTTLIYGCMFAVATAYLPRYQKLISHENETASINEALITGKPETDDSVDDLLESDKTDSSCLQSVTNTCQTWWQQCGNDNSKGNNYQPPPITSSSEISNSV